MFYEEKIREALKTDKFQVLNWQNDPTAKGAFREELLYKKTLEILALQTECDVTVPGIRVSNPSLRKTIKRARNVFLFFGNSPNF